MQDDHMLQRYWENEDSLTADEQSNEMLCIHIHMDNWCVNTSKHRGPVPHILSCCWSCSG